MNDHSDQEILPSEEEEEIEYENASTADGVATGFSNNRSLPVVPALVSFWIIGLCNNFAYVVMLSAAQDILSKTPANETVEDPCPEDISHLKCSSISTGAILLADIIPSLLIKIIAPFFLQSLSYLKRHTIVVVSQVLSFLLVATSNDLWISILGVVFASIGAGLGEVTYLSLTAHFHSDVVSFWSSGTGAAGIFGSLAFAILTDKRLFGVSPKNALLLMLVIPAIQATVYWLLLNVPRASLNAATRTQNASVNASNQLSPDSGEDTNPLLSSPNNRVNSPITTQSNLRRIKPLLKFMLPLTAVYFAEYLINQGLTQLMVFNCEHSLGLGPLSQYRWFQVLYQVGVFISRSSSKFVKIPQRMLPYLAILQFINFGALFSETLFPFLPHILVAMIVIMYEGLLGGGAYVNTFNAVHDMIPKRDLEFSMSFVSTSDSFGVLFAGLLAIPLHNFICAYRR